MPVCVGGWLGILHICLYLPSRKAGVCNVRLEDDSPVEKTKYLLPWR